MSALRIDPQKSHLRVETRAKGLLAKLAHDLSLEARAPQGTCRVEADRFTLELEVPVAALRVVGVRKGDRVDTSVLGASDLDEIHRKLREEVLVGRASVAVRAEGRAPAGGAREELRGELSVQAGRGEQRVTAPVVVRREGDRTIVEGKAVVSLDALRIPPVKAPLGAFRVDDAIEIHAHLELTEGGAG